MEKDPMGIGQHQSGAKLDAGKAPIFRGVISYFPRAIGAVAELSAYGANKYAWKGWEAVPDGINRYSDALGRHITKEAIEGPYDKEILNDPKYPASILHATQVAWNALARLELMLRPARQAQPGQGTITDIGIANGVRGQMDPVTYTNPHTEQQYNGKGKVI